ncbi:hypothetical protein ABMB67_002142 [Halalkalibacter oceani]
MTESILIAGNSEFALEQASEHGRWILVKMYRFMAVKSMERMQGSATFLR